MDHTQDHVVEMLLLLGNDQSEFKPTPLPPICSLAPQRLEFNPFTARVSLGGREVELKQLAELSVCWQGNFTSHKHSNEGHTGIMKIFNGHCLKILIIPMDTT